MKRTKAASPPRPDPGAALRARAEAAVSAAGGESSPPPEDLERLVHELRVQQIERELQNEELRRAQEELSAARDRYAELYDFSPVGYLTLGRGGRIEAANLTAATLLGTARGALLGTPFSHYVGDAREDQDAYCRHRRHTLASPGTHTCGLRLRQGGGELFHARLQSCAVSEDGEPEGRVRVVVVDVTAEWDAEALVQAGEARYRALAEQAGVGIYHTAADGHCTYVNPRWCELAGLTLDEAQGKGWVRALHPEDREWVYAAWTAAVKERRPFELEYRFQTPGGRVSWLHGTARSLLADAGRPLTYVGTVTDVSEARRASAALGRSEARFRGLFDHLGAGVVVYEPAAGGEDFVIRDLNRAAERIGQVRKAEVLGRGVLQTFSGVRALGLFAVLQRVAQTGRAEGLPAATYDDGVRAVSVENYVFRLPTGEVVGVFDDVTGRVRAEARLRESEARYRVLFESETDAVLVVDAGSRSVEEANRAARALFGHLPEAWRGLAAEELLAAPPEAGADGGGALWAESRSGYAPLLRFRRLDESTFLGEVTSAAFAVEGQQKLLVCIRDVTERIRADEELLRYSRRLDILRELDRAVRSVEQHPRDLSAAALVRLGDLVAFDLAWVAGARGLDLEVLAVRPGDAGALQVGQRFKPADLGDPGSLVAGHLLGVPDLGADAHLSPVLAALARAGGRAFAAVPFIVRGGLTGVLGLSGAEAFSLAELSVAADVAGVLALALENTRLLAEARDQSRRLRVMAQHLQRAEASERDAISRELHDAVGQGLTALGLNLHVVEAGLPPDVRIRLGPRIDDSLELLAATTRKVRNLMAELRPPVLADYGLRAALRGLAEQFEARTGIAVCATGEEPSPRLAPDQESVLFRVVQEALTNVTKHARARRVEVWLETNDQGLCRVMITDDGVGFDHGAASSAPGWGLAIMADRLEAIGGALRIEAAPGGGTRVTAEVPR